LLLSRRARQHHVLVRDVIVIIVIHL
jgi:hypothetical protein